MGLKRKHGVCVKCLKGVYSSQLDLASGAEASRTSAGLRQMKRCGSKRSCWLLVGFLVCVMLFAFQFLKQHYKYKTPTS